MRRHSMGPFVFGTVVLLLGTLTASGEDDFGFEQDKNLPLQRLWGIPDTTAHIGHFFHFKVPENAFEGNIARYKAFNENGGPLPSWLMFDEKTGVLEGVPVEEDLGEHYITIKAFDQNLHDFVKDVFALEVLSSTKSQNAHVKDTCKAQEDKTVLTLILDTDYRNLGSKERVTIIKNLVGFFDVHEDTVRICKQDDRDEMLSDSVIAAGPGNVKRRTAKSSTVLQWQVGCHGNVWSKFLSKVDRAKCGAKDGTLAEVIQHPVIGWRLSKDDYEFRRRREVYGSGEVDVDDEEDDESVPESRVVVTNTATPVFQLDLSPTVTSYTPTTHAHRHRHGNQSPTSYSVPIASIMPTPTYIPERPTSYYSIVEDIQSSSATFSTLSPTSFISSTTQDSETSENERLTTLEHNISESATPPMPDISTASEEITYETKNFQPTIGHRLQKLAVTAGKLLSYTVPQETFYDLEDGNARNLNLSLSSPESFTIPTNSWIQFDPKTQEIYALPLEEHVSKWLFSLVATDSGGLTVQDKVEVLVQNHKARRTVNHAFSVEVISTPVTIALKWQIMLLDAIRDVFSDPDTSQITVLSINTTSHPMSFTWTNDSLPRNYCPRKEIEGLVKILNGQNGLKSRLENNLVIGKVTWTGKSQCEARAPPPQATNYAPVPRNQVDHLNATVGQLLIFTVPEDSFYDPEDGSTRNLKLSLVTIDRRPIPSNHWLQFDVKNQEFYGIPISENVGQMEYQLICEDSGGLTAHDGLVVIVYPAAKTMYNVEFSMRLGLEYNTFVESPLLQRNFVQRLALLFGDANSNAIVLSGIAPGSTVVTWHNKTLPTNICPDDEIRQLRQIMLGDDERVTAGVGRVLGPEFPVLGARLTPTGLCQGALTEVSGGGGEPPTSDVTAVSHSEQYIIGLVVPAVVIAVMLLCAGLVACILYRRRRTGKMSVGDEDERQSFRSKGIPVIFQDELDERPEPTNKSPVIMKEEKPPLPPPEYQRGGGGPPLATTALLSDTEDSLYQPPPPFAGSRDAARPKPTPTYRMPPPYVPP